MVRRCPETTTQEHADFSELFMSGLCTVLQAAGWGWGLAVLPLWRLPPHTCPEGSSRASSRGGSLFPARVWKVWQVLTLASSALVVVAPWPRLCLCGSQSLSLSSEAVSALIALAAVWMHAAVGSLEIQPQSPTTRAILGVDGFWLV